MLRGALEPEEAKKRAEGLRYRLQVRAANVAKAARQEGDQTVLIAVDQLKSDIRAIEVGDDEWVEPKAYAELQKLEPRIVALEDAIGVKPYGAQPMPKWLRYLAITAPVLLGVFVLLIILARRRKKVELTQEQLARLEQ
jgi:hypothetical protein